MSEPTNGRRTIYCGWCGKEHYDDSAILRAHQDKLAQDPKTYGAKDRPKPSVIVRR